MYVHIIRRAYHTHTLTLTLTVKVTLFVMRDILGHFERPSWPFRVYSAYRQLSHFQLTTNIASVRGLGFFLFFSQEVGCQVVVSLTVPYFSGSSSILAYTNID